MIFKRKVYDKLLEWKELSAGTSAVLLEGARRIGKSTIVEEFAKQEYKSYILIDFAKASEDVKSYFYLYLDDLDTFLMLLSVQYGKELFKRESLIIFDEVQLFPKAREAVKYLVEDGKMRPPFGALNGVGDTAAWSIYETAQKGDFLSKEDFRIESGISKTILEQLDAVGVLSDLPDSNQLSFF